VARFLAGRRPVTLVNPPLPRPLQLRVTVPVPDLTAPPPLPGSESEAGALWPHLEAGILAAVLRHHTTLVFTNSRALAEKLTARLNARWQQQQRDEQQQQRREQRAERQRRRQEEKRAQQQEEKAVESVTTEEIPAVDAAVQEEERVQVMPRRKPRQLTQRIRSGEVMEASPAAAQPEAAAEIAPPVNTAEQPEMSDEQDDNENREGANMPRRSRRSPRHLRVSGQRRRRYRDERYPLQSPMPLDAAAASPEMASGKVWVSYPVTQTHEQFTSQAPLNEMTEYGYQDAADALPVAAEAASAGVPQPETSEVVHQAEPQAHTEVPVVNTDDLTPVAAPVDHEPAVISAADEAVAQETAAEAEPAIVTENVSEEAPQPAVQDAVQPTVTEAAAAAEQAPADVTPAVETQVEKVLSAPVAAEAPAAPVAEPHAPVPARDVSVEQSESRFKLHATAPMTRAPAPAWEPEPARHSDWVRPPFSFEGRGSAGGHSATHQATAPATRPDSV